MLTLGINTSGPACDVAVCEAGQILAERNEGMVRGQDARLAALVEEVVTEAGYSLADLQRIGIVTGPGSFTGVRVGVAFAKGLALALDIPCIGVTSLEASLPDGQQGSAIVLLPAKRRPPDISYWGQRFRTGKATGAPEELGLDDLAAELSAHPHFVFGTGLEALSAVVPGLKTHEAAPSAARVAHLAATAADAAASANPVYVRAPDAALPGGRKP